MEPYTWHLSNLTMLGERLNTKAENAEYSIKQAKYSAPELIMAKRSAQEYSHWDRFTIIDGAKNIGHALKEIWNYDNPYTL